MLAPARVLRFAILGATIAASIAATAAANTYQVVINHAASWDQAKVAAQGAGGYLATITSSSEQAAVEAAIAAASPVGEGGFWINLREVTECCYVWDNGETTCYGHFYQAEPNNGSSSETRGQIIWSNNLSRRGWWNDMIPGGTPFGSADLGRFGYVIEFGPTDPAPTCAPCIPVDPASFCATAPSSDLGAQVYSVSGLNPVMVTLRISNKGPDVYNAGTCGITVDIDDPTKPGLPGVATGCTGGIVDVTFPVAVIPVNGSALVNVGAVGTCTGPPVSVSASVLPRGGFIDPDPGNDTNTVTVQELEFAVPAANWPTAAILAGLVLLVAWVQVRRRAA